MSSDADSEELWREAQERERLESMTSERRLLQERAYQSERRALEKARDGDVAPTGGGDLAADVNSLNVRLARYVEFVGALEKQTKVCAPSRETPRTDEGGPRAAAAFGARPRPSPLRPRCPPLTWHAPPAGNGSRERRAQGPARLLACPHERRAAQAGGGVGDAGAAAGREGRAGGEHPAVDARDLRHRCAPGPRRNAAPASHPIRAPPHTTLAAPGCLQKSCGARCLACSG